MPGLGQKAYCARLTNKHFIMTKLTQTEHCEYKLSSINLIDDHKYTCFS